MSAPQHDPELFEELMREERRRRPVSRGRSAIAVVVFGLLMFAGVLCYRAIVTPKPDPLPANEAHGLDVVAGQCFWSPTGTGEVDVLLTSCTERHTAEAFAVLPLPEGADAPYQPTLDRCTAAAQPIPDARVQVMTPYLSSSKHLAVCYYRFTIEMTASVG
ncbi:hypothetical protein H4696_004457 [Amycolatopsis lexingtonensis]|uniref:Septum formation-related domain-containing protein n=1 Tax=Amycolatopsis lexingtonensis TaxID=218822 RepID=A0ABR9I2C3_9PSEU|nr:hypothetical protein [Amycolatopsis lexingtonensis]MBE1497357.1 hypothetical protein [Amycolatopsis lexingtonensis]